MRKAAPKSMACYVILWLCIILTTKFISAYDYFAFLTSSNDGGQSWSKPAALPYSNMFKNCKLSCVEGTWYLHGSSLTADSVLYTSSNDQGLTWSSPQVYASGLNASQISTWLDSTGFYILLVENSGYVSVIPPDGFMISGTKVNNISPAITTHPGDIVRTLKGTVYIAFLETMSYNRFMISRDTCQTWSDQNIEILEHYSPKYSVIDSGFVVASNHYGTGDGYNAKIQYTTDDGNTWSGSWVNISQTSGTTIDGMAQVAQTAPDQYIGIWFASNNYQIESRYTTDLNTWPGGASSLDTLFTDIHSSTRDLSLNTINDDLYLIFFNSKLFAPAAPQRLSLMVEESQVKLEWVANAESDISEYILFRNTSNDTMSWDTLAIVSHPIPSYLDNTVSNNNIYHYWIKTSDNSGLQSNTAYFGQANLFTLGNYAVRFDGMDDFLLSKYTTSLGLDYTVEFWFKFNDFESVAQVFSRSNSPACRYEPSIRLFKNTEFVLNAYVSGCGGEGIIGSQTVTSGQWHHVAVSATSGIQNYYVNGNLINSSSNTNYSTIEKFSIGAYPYLRSGISPLNGIIDEVRVWDTSRTQTQIQAAMYDTLTSNYYSTTDSGLVAYWRLDGNATDLSVNANHGEVFGAAEFIASNAPLYKTEVQMSDSLLIFNTVSGNEFSEEIISITNIGTDTLEIFDCVISGQDITSFSIYSGGGAVSVPPSEIHTITLRFAPDTSGQKNAVLEIYCNSLSSPELIELQGFRQIEVNGDSWLVFARYESDLTNADIYRVKTDNTKLTNITNTTGVDDIYPRISPDGQKILFASNRDGDYELYSMSPTGNNLRKLTDNDVHDIDGAWSPDGSQIVFLHDYSFSTHQGEMYVMDSTGSNTYQLTYDLNPVAGRDWGTKGILFCRYYGANGWSDIFTIQPDGSGLMQLTTNDNADECWPRWSRDEAEFVYSSQEAGQYDLYKRDADGTNKSYILYRASRPAWSPDSDSLACDKIPISGSNEINIVHKDGSGARQVTNLGNQSLRYSFDWGYLDAELLLGVEFTKIITGDIVTNTGNSRGLAWGDYNNDGFDDLFVANTNYQNNYLYENNGDGTFTRITVGDIVSSGGHSYTGSWGDYDNDGNLDIAVFNTNEVNQLFRNNGDGTFTRISDSPITTINAWSTGGSWGDYNNDGFLDLIVANADYAYNPNNFLFRNNGDASFTQITEGDIVNDGGYSFCPSWADYNNDGHLDAFVVNDATGELNFLYRNNGDGTFARVLDEPFSSDGEISLGASWSDYDNDGDLDLYLTRSKEGNNHFYENNGDGTFTRLDSINIIAGDDVSFGCSWADFNNDGYLDLLVTNKPGDNCLYFNNGDKTFTQIYTGALIADGLKSHACAVSDYDNDGFPDIYIVTDETEPGLLFHNDGNANHWLQIRCSGVASNTSAIGTKIYIKANIYGQAFWQLREISGQTGGGLGSQNSLRAMFGLGDATMVDSVKLEWPSGIVQVLTDVSADQILTINEEVPERIDNSVIYAHFDHTRGMIDSLTFKMGSNNELLEQSWNTANQHGLGSLGLLEDGLSRPSNINFTNDSASVTYINHNYGSKTFKLRWSAELGFEMDMIFNITTEALEGAVWQPGGDNDGNDTVKVIKSNFSTVVMPYTYPGSHQTLYDALSYGAGVWDGDYDEVYGYVFKNLHQLSISNGASADGPFPTIPSGRDTVYFAIKSTAGFWDWVSQISGYQPIDFIHTLSVTDFNNETKDLLFGTDPAATDGYDSEFDLYAPPAPLPGAFDARFRHDGEDYIDDIRPTNTGTMSWEVLYQPSAGGEPVTLTWDSQSLPQGRLKMVDAATGGLLTNIDMKAESTFVDVAGINNLYIRYTLAEAFVQNVSWGWNLLGLAYDASDAHYLNLFPEAAENTLYGFNGSYYGEDTLEAGTGYWLRFYAPASVPVQGYPIDELNIDLVEGWNMISGVSGNLSLAMISDPGTVIIPGTLFGFEGVYVAQDTIKQGMGYWIRAYAAGQISLDLGSTVLPKKITEAAEPEVYSMITIQDAKGLSQGLYFDAELADPLQRLSYSLPPKPPLGSFDVRFTGDYRLTEGDESMIEIQAADYPLTVTVEQLNVEEHYGYVLEEVEGKDVLGSHEVHQGCSIQIDDQAVKTLRLRRVEILPQCFVVYQNYPNPFNPATEIRYGLPQDAEVEIVIYNTIGQKVRTLYKASQKAGYHQINWDGRNEMHSRVSTGIYFYRVKAGKHHAIKKMILLK